MSNVTVLYEWDANNYWTARCTGTIGCQVTAKSRAILEELVSDAMLRAGYRRCRSERALDTIRQQWQLNQ